MIYEVRRFCYSITETKRVLYQNGESAGAGAELNPIVSIVHALFVLLSGLFVILEAKSLFAIALIIYPQNGDQTE